MTGLSLVGLHASLIVSARRRAASGRAFAKSSNPKPKDHFVPLQSGSVSVIERAYSTQTRACSIHYAWAVEQAFQQVISSCFPAERCDSTS